METVDAEIAAWQDALFQVYQQIIAALPAIAGAILVLVIGWIVGRILAAGFLRIGSRLNRLLDRLLPENQATDRVRLGPSALRIVSRIIFWLVILVAVTVASRIAGLDAFFGWLDKTVTYLPTLFAGALIVAGGYLVSLLARDVTIAALDSARVANSAALGRMAQWATLLTAMIIGIDQIGINLSFMALVIGITLGATLGGIALAFALGSKTYVANLIAARNVRTHYRPGQQVRIGEHEGEVLSVTSTGVLLETRLGRLLLPANMFSEQPSTLVQQSQSPSSEPAETPPAPDTPPTTDAPPTTEAPKGS